MLAQKFLDAVDQLNRDLGIPTTLEALKKEDIPELAKAACWEAHTGYPVPRYMTQQICEDIIRQALPRAQPAAKPAVNPAPAKPATAKAVPGKAAKPAPAKAAKPAPAKAAPAKPATSKTQGQ